MKVKLLLIALLLFGSNGWAEEIITLKCSRYSGSPHLETVIIDLDEKTFSTTEHNNLYLLSDENFYYGEKDRGIKSKSYFVAPRETLWSLDQIIIRLNRINLTLEYKSDLTTFGCEKTDRI